MHFLYKKQPFFKKTITNYNKKERQKNIFTLCFQAGMGKSTYSRYCQSKNDFCKNLKPKIGQNVYPVLSRFGLP